MLFRNYILNLVLILGMGIFSHTSYAQMVAGESIPGFEETFDLPSKQIKSIVEAKLIHSTAPGNVLWKGEKIKLTVQLFNTSNANLQVNGHIDLIRYGTKGQKGNMWVPHMFKISEVQQIPLHLEIKGKQFVNVAIGPKVPETYGGYGLVADLGPKYGRKFLGSFVRTFSVPNEDIEYPAICQDRAIGSNVLQRLRIHAVRYGLSYVPTNSPSFNTWYRKLIKDLKELQNKHITVMIMVGQQDNMSGMVPLNLPRPWLDKNGIMLNRKCDNAWLPSYDDDFKKFCFMISRDMGYPKGPVTAFSLWNEPWESVSISGWGADIPRYRELYNKMFQGVDSARQNCGVTVLVGGCGSSSNALDKLFPNGTKDYLDKFDFNSEHYQGLNSFAGLKIWKNRKSKYGRVKIWDTESWIANMDDRVGAAIAVERSAGYDRAMGVYRGNISRVKHILYQTTNGQRDTTMNDTWSVAAALGAATHFIGNRSFNQILFKKGLPWIYLFNGLDHHNEDGTIVVVGNIGEEFGRDNTLFRTVAISKDAQMILTDSIDRFSLFDIYGNRILPKEKKYTIPLDGRSFYLKGNGAKGDFSKLVHSIRNSRINGIDPLEVIFHDFTLPLDQHPSFHLTVTNVLNRTVTGKIKVSSPKILFADSVIDFTILPHTRRELLESVSRYSESPANTYHVQVNFFSSDGDTVRREEDVHVNYIPYKKIKVDGDLSEWNGRFPQIIIPAGKGTPTTTEAAYLPFQKFDTTTTSETSVAYLAYDENNFYFAAKVGDKTPEDGMMRFENRKDDDFFYPDTSYIQASSYSFGGAKKNKKLSFSVCWEGHIKVPSDGNYSFLMTSKGRSIVEVDGNKIFDAVNDQNAKDSLITLHLKKKLDYSVKIKYNNMDVSSGQISFDLEKSEKKNEKSLNKLLVGKWDVAYYAGDNFNYLLKRDSVSTIHLKWDLSHLPIKKLSSANYLPLVWPKGVRHFSYRKEFETPSGNAPLHDNIQIAFNVLGQNRKPISDSLKGTMPKYAYYTCTDYEYALNKIAPEYGGGTEVWRLRKPGMPHKHFFPRQPKCKYDGPVKGANLSIVRKGNTIYYECSIPWTELPDVKERIEAGETIKFSYRVNDNCTNNCLELSKGRSVAKRNLSFYADWKEHWANELEFGTSKMK